MLTLQDMEQDGVKFDLAADSVEELFEWYQVAWDITQREMSKKRQREQEASISSEFIRKATANIYTSLLRMTERPNYGIYC